MKVVGRKIKELRALKGWTQEELARKVGVSLSSVQRWEARGARPIPIIRKILARLFQESGVKIDN